MINPFEKQLEKWNNGILRGAQARLAKELHVSTAIVALWATGKRTPSKGFIAKMAGLFKLPEERVQRLFAQKTCLHNTPGLREATSFTPQTQRDTALPFFTAWPTDFPLHKPQAVSGWWLLPKQQANGAKLAMLCPDNPRITWFILPQNTWQHNQVMLARHQQKIVAGRVVMQPGHRYLVETNGKQIALNKLIALGQIVRQLTDVE